MIISGPLSVSLLLRYIYTCLRCHVFFELPSPLLYPAPVPPLLLRLLLRPTTASFLRARHGRLPSCCSSRVEVSHLLFFHRELSSISDVHVKNSRRLPQTNKQHTTLNFSHNHHSCFSSSSLPSTELQNIASYLMLHDPKSTMVSSQYFIQPSQSIARCKSVVEPPHYQQAPVFARNVGPY